MSYVQREAEYSVLNGQFVVEEEEVFCSGRFPCQRLKADRDSDDADSLLQRRHSNSCAVSVILNYCSVRRVCVCICCSRIRDHRHALIPFELIFT